MVCGIINYGATCYLNTTIQGLLSNTLFTKYIVEFDSECKSPLFTVFQMFVKRMKEASTQKGVYIDPKELLAVIHRSMGNMIEVNTQNDITEFLMCFIEKLKESICVSLNIPPLVSYLETAGCNLDKYNVLKHKIDYAWLKSHEKEYSPLCDLMYGQTISQIECGNCRKIHHNYEVFNCLLLSIPEFQNAVVNLDSCLDNHFKDHVINGLSEKSDKWVCDKCKSSTESIQSSKLWRIPDVFTIAFKRFDAQLNKNRTPVKVPDVLDMSQWTLSREKKNVFSLKAIGVHIGSFHGGHYYAVIQDTNQWLKVDDETVGILPSHDFQTVACNGYIYFYERS